METGGTHHHQIQRTNGFQSWINKAFYCTTPCACGYGSDLHRSCWLAVIKTGKGWRELLPRSAWLVFEFLFYSHLRVFGEDDFSPLMSRWNKTLLGKTLLSFFCGCVWGIRSCLKAFKEIVVWCCAQSGIVCVETLLCCLEGAARGWRSKRLYVSSGCGMGLYWCWWCAFCLCWGVSSDYHFPGLTAGLPVWFIAGGYTATHCYKLQIHKKFLYGGL